jgi:hypothetical protein
LAIAAGCAGVAPDLGSVERQHRIDEISQGGAQGFIVGIPVGDALDVLVADPISQLCQGLRAELRPTGHDRGGDLVDLIRRAGGPPADGNEVVGPMEGPVDRGW